MDKRNRHRIIKEIVAAQAVATQEDLVLALRGRGVAVTQATVSRDMAEIPLQKMRRGGGVVYDWQGSVAEPGGQLARVAREFVLGVNRSENLVLLKTVAGTAAPVAIAIDGAQLEPVLGTIAGDDTVLVIAKDKEAGHRAYEALARMVE